MTPIASATGSVSPRRAARSSNSSRSAAAALTPTSLFTDAPMNVNIGFSATISAAPTANRRRSPATSRAASSTNSTVSAASSAEAIRIAVSCVQIEAPPAIS